MLNAREHANLSASSSTLASTRGFDQSWLTQVREQNVKVAGLPANVWEKATSVRNFHNGTLGLGSGLASSLEIKVLDAVLRTREKGQDCEQVHDKSECVKV